MRVTVGIVGFVWFLAASAVAFQPLVFKPQTTYVYEAESSVLAGIPELADQYSGFSMAYKVIIKVPAKDKVVFQLKDVRTGKLNDEVPVSYAEGVDFQHTPSPLYERELVKPIIAYYKDGLIEKFQAEEDDETWSVNIKRAIISQFQLDLLKSGDPVHARNAVPHDIHPEATIFKVFEDGIGGECQTRYMLLSIPSLDHPDQSEDVLNVTKVKNYGNCKSRPQFSWLNYDSQGCPDACRSSQPFSPLSKSYPSGERTSAFPTGCPYGFQPDFHPVKSFSVSKYNISGVSHQPLIEDIYSEGKTIYSFNGDELMVYVEQNFTLLLVEPTKGAAPLLRKPQLHNHLEYEIPVDEEEHGHLEFAFYSIFGPVQSKEVAKLVLKKLHDVAEDIIPDDPKSSEFLGPKIIHLVSAIIVMEEEDIQEVLMQIERPRPGQRVARKPAIMRKVFLDALGIAGTNTAAAIVLDLVKTNRVSLPEAIELLESIAKNTQHPNETIIQLHLELLDSPRVQSKQLLFNAIALGFGQLIDQACVAPKIVPEHFHMHSKSAHSVEDQDEDEDVSPARSRGPKPKSTTPLKPGCTSQELQSYIKEIVERLRKEEDLSKKATYIRALAFMSTPMVLPYLEPYIKGEADELESIDDEEVDFLRDLAIYALHEVNDYYPQEVLRFVVPIYFDVSEDYEHRIAAFSVLMESRPGLGLLERIASELWDESNNQVLNYVYSYLDSYANSSAPCDRRIAQQVQLILAHAPEVDLGLQYSNIYSYDFYDDDKDYGMSVESAWVASNVSMIPRNAYFSFSHINGPFEDELLTIGYNAKGIDELIDKITRPGGILAQLTSKVGSNVEAKNIDDVLDIVKSKLAFIKLDSESPRAMIYYNILGRTNHLNLNEQHLLKVIEDVIHWFSQIDPTSGETQHYVKVFMPSSFTKMVPSVMGLPVILTQVNPVIFSLVLENMRVSVGEKREVPSESAFAASAIIRPSIHVATISVAGALSPAEDLVYGTAVERVYEISVPLVVDLAVDLKKDIYAFSVKPKLPHQIVSHFTRPTTFVTKAVVIDISKEEWLGDVNVIESIPEPLKFERSYKSAPLGVALRAQVETEDPWSNIPFYLSGTAYDDGVLPAFMELLKNPGMTPREYHLYIEPHTQEPAAQFVVTLDYDREISFHKGQPSSDNYEEDDEPQENDLFEEYEEVLSSIYGKRQSQRIPLAHKTIEHLIKKTQPTWSPVLGMESDEPVPATIAHILELTAVVKGSKPKHLAAKATYAHTLDHRSIWFQVIAHQSVSGIRQVPWQLCADAVVAYPQAPNPFYLEMNALHAQKAKLRAELGWGVDCSKENQFVVLGVMEKSEEQLSSSSNVYMDSDKGKLSLPWYYHECQVDRSEGETQSEACDLAISDAAQLNRIELEIVAQELSPAVRNLTSLIEHALKSYLYPNMEVNPLVSNPEDSLRIVIESIDQIEDIDLTNVFIYKPSENIFFHKLYTPYFEPPSTLDRFDELYADQFFGDDYIPSCNLMEDFISTFDNVTYPIPDDKCQYLLAQDASDSKSFTILASQIDIAAKTKALAVSVASHVIKMMPPRGAVVPVIVDGTQVTVSAQKPFILEFNKPNEIYMYVKETAGHTDTPILVLEIKNVDLSIEYDGKNAEISVSRSFLGDLRGLCGDFNGEWVDEFTGPLGCTYVDVENFISSYAIPGQSCVSPRKPTGPAFCPDSKLQEKINKWVNDSDDSEPIPSRHSSPRYIDEDADEDELEPVRRRTTPKPYHRPIVEDEDDNEDQPWKPSRHPSRAPHKPKKPQRDYEDEVVPRSSRRYPQLDEDEPRGWNPSEPKWKPRY